MGAGEMMKTTFLIVLLLGGASLVAADDKSSDKIASPSPAKTQVAGIPADAVQIAPYTYRFSDAKGTVWIYRQTPFGVSRREDVPVSPEEAKKNQEARDRLIEATRAVEEGESIHFTRDSPFGPMQWTRNKADLNEIEQAVWSRELAKRAITDTGSKD
jgi:hypothetical protein